AGKVDEKDFVKAAFAKHFGRERGNVVGSGGEEDAGFAILHPGEQCGEEALGKTSIGVAASACGGEGFLDFVDPKNDRRHFLCEFETFAKLLFAFADELVVERACIEASKFESPFAGNGFGSETFAAALYARDENSFWRNEAEF